MSEHTLDLLALSLVPGLGDKNIKQLISYCGSPNQVFKSTKGKLESIPGFGAKTAGIIANHKTHGKAEGIIKEAESKGMTVLNCLEASFPTRLKSVMDCPNVLFKRGDGNLNMARSVAVVGTRKATDYGKRITQNIVKGLKQIDAQVVSGLAYGIDIEAHKTALKEKQSTVAVLAGGLDKIYPAIHKKYAAEMEGDGALLTESVPGTKPEAHLFPARNRIIAGMTDATIVVEAAEKGGALITANIADSYDRVVFAVPGDLGNNFSSGTNKLIRAQKALIFTGVEDLLYHLNWSMYSPSNQPIELPELEEKEEVIYSLLKKNGKPIEIDLIAAQTQMPINQVASHLLGLEFKNLVKSLPGKKFGLT